MRTVPIRVPELPAARLAAEAAGIPAANHRVRYLVPRGCGCHLTQLVPEGFARPVPNCDEHWDGLRGTTLESRPDSAHRRKSRAVRYANGVADTRCPDCWSKGRTDCGARLLPAPEPAAARTPKAAPNPLRVLAREARVDREAASVRFTRADVDGRIDALLAGQAARLAELALLEAADPSLRLA